MRTNFKKNSFVLPLLIFACSILSQTKDIKFDWLTSAQGLPGLSVCSVLKDDQGFLWIATEGDGLLRFDGYNYKKFKTSQEEGSLSNNIVLCLLEDSKGTLWAGTNEGLNKFDKQYERFFAYKHNPNANSISNNIINCIFEDKQGLLWIGTRGGINTFNGEKFASYKNIPNDSNSLCNNDVRCIYEDNTSTLWIGTNNGLNSYNKRDTFVQYRHDDQNPSSISGNSIRSVQQNKNGTIWVATGSGLNKLIMTSGTSKFLRYLDEPRKFVMYILENDDGCLWLATIGGLVIFDPLTETYTENKFEDGNRSKVVNPFIPSIYKDKTGTIWISTGQGICYYNPNKTRFNNYLRNNAIISVNTDSHDNLYMGTEGNGLWQMDSTRRYEKRILYNNKPPQIQAHNFVPSTNSSLDDRLLIGFERDLYEFEIKKNRFIKFPAREGRFRIWDILIDREGFIWLAPMTEIVILDSQKNEIASIKHKGDTTGITEGYVTVLFEDNSGAIWAGTTSGLNRITVTRSLRDSILSFRIKQYKNSPNDPQSISGNNITSIYEDDIGILWIGTHNGLNRLDKSKDMFSSYTESDGLPDISVQSILPDNSGNLWLGTDKGLAKFNPKTAKFKNYGTADGLPNKFMQNACHKGKNGEMFFGTENGVISFYPDSIKENPNVPPIEITSFKVFNKEAILSRSILSTEEITLTYKENFFSFEFSALDFTVPAKNQYSYVLEGVDENWVNTTALKREASYTDIAPGEYTFHVKGSNNDGLWNNEGKSIKIIITPPWWLTWWAKGIYILTAISLLGFVRHRKLTKIRSEMHKQVEFTRQLIESQEQERKRIAGELHDSLGQNLLIMKNKTTKILRSEEISEKTREQINDISALTMETLSEVRTISHNLRPIELDRLGLTKTLRALVERASASTMTSFTIDIDDIDSVLSPEKEIGFYRILQECINNIIKHSQATKAEVIIKKKVNKINIQIRDNGAGMPQNHPKGMGLTSLSERTKLMNAKLEINSAPKKGTEIHIEMPAGNIK